MKLSRTDLLPVLTIMAGGVLGASLSIGLLWSPEPVATSYESVRRAEVLGSEEQKAARITVNFPGIPIEQVLFTFSEFSGKSIVVGTDVAGISITADIRDQAWDDAMEKILQSRGLVAVESETGIIRVDAITNIFDREAIEPLETVPYRINFLTSAEMTTAITQLISDRGQVAESQAANTVIVTDIRRVHDAIGQLIGELDIPTPQIMISAKIIFRADLEAPGVNGFYTMRGFVAEDVEQKPIR